MLKLKELNTTKILGVVGDVTLYLALGSEKLSYVSAHIYLAHLPNTMLIEKVF